MSRGPIVTIFLRTCYLNDPLIYPMLTFLILKKNVAQKMPMDKIVNCMINYAIMTKPHFVALDFLKLDINFKQFIFYFF